MIASIRRSVGRINITIFTASSKQKFIVELVPSKSKLCISKGRHNRNSYKWPSSRRMPSVNVNSNHPLVSCCVRLSVCVGLFYFLYITVAYAAASATSTIYGQENVAVACLAGTEWRKVSARKFSLGGLFSTAYGCDSFGESYDHFGFQRDFME